MSLSLIPSFLGTWSNTTQYAVRVLSGVSPISYLSPTVDYSGNLYIANFNGGLNPPVGAVPGVSSLWTLFSTAGGGGGVTSFNTRTGVVTAQTGDYTVSQVTGAAPLAGPIFTGFPLAPTPLPIDNNNIIATTAAILAKTLDGFIAAPGLVTSADSILTALQKIVGNTPSAYTVVHDTVDHQFLASEIKVIMDADAKVGTLPPAASVIVGVDYSLKMGVGANTGTLAVPIGEDLNGTLNGTFAIVGVYNSASAFSDGTAWFTN
jgi:hypothetical protein